MRTYSIEERIARVRARLLLLREALHAEANDASDINSEIVAAGAEQVTEDCLDELDYLSAMPAEALNWTPRAPHATKGRAR